MTVRKCGWRVPRGPVRGRRSPKPRSRTLEPKPQTPASKTSSVPNAATETATNIRRISCYPEPANTLSTTSTQHAPRSNADIQDPSLVTCGVQTMLSQQKRDFDEHLPINSLHTRSSRSDRQHHRWHSLTRGMEETMKQQELCSPQSHNPALPTVGEGRKQGLFYKIRRTLRSSTDFLRYSALSLG